jgi:hypothetical protein
MSPTVDEGEKTVSGDVGSGGGPWIPCIGTELWRAGARIASFGLTGEFIGTTSCDLT